MSTKVFVDGQEGTTGLQIHERLARRADVELLQIDTARRKDPAAKAECLNGADIVFLCLPDEAARESVALVTNPYTCVIDASTAHRVDPGWAFGLPELAPEYRKAIRAGKRIANPGCHSTAYLLAMRPLARRGLIPPDFQPSAFSLTGYSGGGKRMIADYQADPQPETLKSPRLYGLNLSHKHLPEMRVHSGLRHAPIFNPVVVNIYQGLAVTIPLPLANLAGAPSVTDIHDVLAAAYAGEPFVNVLDREEAAEAATRFLDIQACNGTNRADLMVYGRDDQAVVIARLDNLGKGASGAAIQSMNLHLGLEEGTGLSG